MNRILPDTSLVEALAALAEGNPGALTALMRCMEELTVDVWPLLCNLDELEIYGPDIWIVYKDICHHDVQQFISRVKMRQGLKQEIMDAKVAR